MTPITKKRTRWNRGFTILEMFLVLAIVGVIASLAGSKFTKFKLRTAQKEVATNLRAIAHAELARFNMTGSFVACENSPSTPLNAASHRFDPNADGWSKLDWRPMGQVRCQYSVELFSNENGQWVRTKGLCDLDDDGEIAEWWLDVDPGRTSVEAEHFALRPSNDTVNLELF